MDPVAIGCVLWPQTSSWPALRDAAIRADQAGARSLWTWDHLMAIEGPWQGPMLEGWSVLAGWAQVTSHATLGLMVAANTFRNPGLTAKLTTTLDHLSGGRAILGIGGAWFEREHEAFGIDFGSGFGERLDRLDEAVWLLRRLLDGEQVTSDGPVYQMRDALVTPPPVQRRVPIMIGGSGPKKTLRTLAKYGDQWNVMGRLEKLEERDGILRRHCEDIGRDHAEIERTTTVDVVIRRDRKTARADYRAYLAASGQEYDETYPAYLGGPSEVADALGPLVALGFRHLFIDMADPYDLETIERIGDLLGQLNG